MIQEDKIVNEKENICILRKKEHAEGLLTNEERRQDIYRKKNER